MKKLLSIVLTIILVVTLIPVVQIDSYAAGTITQQQVEAKLAAAEKVWPDGSTYQYTANSGGARQCFGFCRELFYYVFGAQLPTQDAIHDPAATYWNLSSYPNVKQIGHLGSGYTVASLKSLLAQARPGDTLIASNNKTNHHVMIRSVASGGEGIYVYDANWDGRNGIKTNRYWSASSIQSYKPFAVTLYRYVNYSDATTPTPLNLGSDFYGYLVLVKDWKHLTANGGNVEIAKANDNYDPAQIWRFVRQSNGSYKIMSAYWDGENGLKYCLDCSNAGTTNGTNVGVCQDDGHAAQRWFIYDKGDFKKMLVPGHCNLALDAKGGNTTAGTNIQLYAQNNGDAQLFNVWPLADNKMTYKKPGKPAAPKYSGPTSGTTGEALTISWAASAKVNDFDKRSYTLKVTDASGNVVANKSGLTATTYKFTPSKAGNYTVEITAVNDYYKNYASSATKATIKVADKTVAVSSITIDRKTMALTVGGISLKLNATVSPENATDKTVTWTSSDSSVASVSSNGTVTGKKVGTATVTAKAGDKTASCAVTVSSNAVPVSSVMLVPSSVTMGVGEEKQLTATVEPSNATDKTVSWKIGDSSIATVTNGKVKGLKAGTTTVTATAGGKSASCKVTVQESSSGNVPVTSITLDKISLVMKEGDTEKLTPTVLPANATQKNVSWSSSDTSVASVDGSGNVTAKKEGTATITVQAEGKTSTCKVTVKKEGTDTVHIDSIEVSKTTLTMTEGDTTSIAVTVKPVEAAKNNVQATNSNGNVIHISAGEASSAENVYNIKIEAKQAGTATITFTGDGKTAECKVTVKEKSSTKPVEETEQHGVNCASAKYTDVNRSESNWTHLPIDYALEKGYMAGISANRFDPNGTVTRAQIVQILYAKEGKPATSGARIFADVPAGQWYTNAIEWASRNKVVAGYTDGTFKPNQAITREQMVTILRAYAGYKGMDTAANGNVNSFPDSGKISNYALQAMKWAVGNGLIGGTGKGIEPQGTATRAQIAVILKAYDKNFG